MLFEIVFPREGLAANSADVRFRVGMRRQVKLHFRSLRESASTDGTSKDVGSLNVGARICSADRLSGGEVAVVDEDEDRAEEDGEDEIGAEEDGEDEVMTRPALAACC